MKIGTVAERLGTTPRTLRFYEERGLVTPRRTPRGTRDYSEGDCQRFAALLALTRAGVSLDEAEALVRARTASTSGSEASTRVGQELTALCEAVTQQREALERLEHTLREARRLVQRCRRCANRPSSDGCPACPVGRYTHANDVLRVLWDESP